MHGRGVIGLLSVVAALVDGCTVGPDFKRPAVPSPEGWSGLDAAAAGPNVKSAPSVGTPEVVAWWNQFADSMLTSLIERAAAGNLSLAQAETRIREARAARTVAASGLYPSVDAAGSFARARAPVLTGPTTSNLFRAGFDATWEIDVFGGIRRGVEAADAQIDSAFFDRWSIQVSLSAEVASAYLGLRGEQRERGIARRNLAAQQQTLEVTQERFDAGFVGSLDVASARAQAALTAAQIPALDSQIRASIYALSVLLGLEPGALIIELSGEAPLPNLPAEVPVGLPSELLERRPDIRMAEADLHAATAGIGVAVADQYPKFSLTGAFGTEGARISSLGTLASRFWSIGPTVSLPVFTGGRVRGNIERSRAAADGATLAYRATILTALQEVETSLVGFTREQERRASLAESVAANREAVDAALDLYVAGKTDFLNVLSAQGQLYSTETALAQSETAVGSDLIALYKALGGGWDGRVNAEGTSVPPR